MLATIKKQIADVTDLTFSEYYRQYIMSIQDSNIEYEFKFMLKRNILNVNSMQLLIDNTYERLKNIYDYNSNVNTDSL